MTRLNKEKLPVAIIGGGPVGLAAAAHLVKKGEEFILFEAGRQIGASVLEWGHVRMFSPWQYNIDQVAKELLDAEGWSTPNLEDVPNGSELVNDYLVPLSEIPSIKKRMVLNAKIVGVAKHGLDKLKTSDRTKRPFDLYVEVDGETTVYQAKAIIDASGTWKNPNPSLSNGIWTKAEKNLSEHITYGIPDVLGDKGTKYSNKTVMVVGSGHSAINTLLDLAKLKATYKDTKIIWVLRKNHVRDVYGGQENDQLPARGKLGIRIQELVETEAIQILTPFYINQIINNGTKITVEGTLNDTDYTVNHIDEMIVATGFRPDTSFLNEVRISLDPALESVEALAPLIDPNIHSCGTVRPHGEEELRQPEEGFYIVGMKSYGRAPTFLLATGYEQVRSVVAYLTGDFKGAKEVQLILPETGVCNSGANVDCCEIEVAKPQTNSCCVEAKVEVKSSSCCGS
ncbi:NAD(P)-binding domain-containing protein [Bacillus sp. 31A1R]|uniref:NAD(P)-binding domain-containing protein n=1 Tax=Robertmurraya mangrovi TaxID=3098077 RepID=A0ABU5IYY2_9BACI|nr:NAD(P)-binding domain-containing protein [Bacillus sp. 31A1R]MDZ5472332.1 NAD(P)-binding domain-containing protein [Bacillus sp. 31A1R]